MALLEAICPECQKPHLWFSGSPDQRCRECITASRHIEAVSAITKPPRSNTDKTLDFVAMTILFAGGAAFGCLLGFGLYYLITESPVLALIVLGICGFVWAAKRYSDAIKDYE